LLDRTTEYVQATFKGQKSCTAYNLDVHQYRK